jgi:hypothetical protein
MIIMYCPSVNFNMFNTIAILISLEVVRKNLSIYYKISLHTGTLTVNGTYVTNTSIGK